MAGNNSIIARFKGEFIRDKTLLRFNNFFALLFSLLPVGLYALFGGLFVFRPTRQFAYWILDENSPVEILTFLAFAVVFILCIRHVIRVIRVRRDLLVKMFFVVFALLVFVAAMEEVSWGQSFLGFQTPEAVESINMQKEFNVHNIAGFHGKTEYVRVTFGFCGLVGVLLACLGLFKEIVPPVFLLSWFVPIFFISVVDLINDYFPIRQNIDFVIENLSELTELLIPIAGIVYILIQSKKLTELINGESNSRPMISD